MALALKKEILLRSRLIKSFSLWFHVASAIQKTSLMPNHETGFILSKNFRWHVISDVCCKQYQNLSLKCFSTSIKPERLCWETSTHAALLRKLESTLKDHQVEEAWEVFNDFKSLYGFPNHSLVSRLITELSYSSDPWWLQKACNLAFLIAKEKLDLLQPNILTKLLLSLGRAQMPIPASMILRLMLEIENLPPMSVLQLIVLHMVKTEIGTYLASNFLFQICDCFLRLTADKSDHAKLVKPDTMIFNLVLDACVRFGSSFKGQQIIELMAQTGVIADAHSIVIIARIHEMNDQRDEMKKFKVHIDRVLVPFVRHYRQFYNSLLSLHFKFNDFEAASELVLDIYRFWQSVPSQKNRKESQIPYVVSIGSHNLKSGLKLQILPELLQKDSVLKVEIKQDLIVFRDGKLFLSNKALAKVIHGYKGDGKISELSKLLLSIQKELNSIGGSSLCSDVIDACICLGWLETAHDILDDMESARAPLSSATYVSLLRAYHLGKKFREAKALLKQMRKAGSLLHLSDETVVFPHLLEEIDKNAPCVSTSSSIGVSDLADSLFRENSEGEKAIPPVVYELNSSIYFFCKAKMIGDALKTYRKMQEMRIRPTMQTFANLVCGYSSMKMYRGITIIWGDIKRNMESEKLALSRDLYEFLLLNFLRGGYFERVMEVIGYMKENNMYTDKWMCKSEFLKFHKNLYRRLKESDARTEAQRKRLEYVLAFRKWVGMD